MAPQQPPAAIASPDLRIALEQALGRDSCEARRIVGIDRQPNDYWSSHQVERIEVRFEDEGTLRVFFKRLGQAGRMEAAVGVKPSFLDDPAREIAVYREILNPLAPGTPVCHGWHVDPAAGRYWLFLEPVAGSLLGEVGDFSVWLEAARWLGRFHARTAEEAERGHWSGFLLRHDAPYFREWIGRARAHSGRAGGWTTARRRQLRWLASRYDRVVEALVSLPRTLIHGEFYPSNLLVRADGEGGRICPVDWEMAAVGPGLIDLAALTTGRWTAAERLALHGAYLGGIPPGASWRPAADGLSTALAFCRIHLAVQWLGWSPGWVAPAEHSRDWLCEAVEVAEGLGI